MFIRDTDRIAVTSGGVVEANAVTPDLDVIWIRPRMSYGVQQAVMGEGVTLEQSAPVARGRKAAKREIEINLGAWQSALLVHNIVAWQGPSFGVVPVTRDNILALDPREPLVQRVINEISERNADAKSEVDEGDDDPKLIDLPARRSPVANGGGTR